MPDSDKFDFDSLLDEELSSDDDFFTFESEPERFDKPAAATEKFVDDLIVSLITEYSRSFDINFCNDGLTETESIIMQSFSKKFISDEWNLKK